MYKQIKDLKSIAFPVYRLPNCDWYIQDKVLFIDGKVLDDKNMPGETLGIRRLQCNRSDLHKLARSKIYTIVDLLNTKHKYFIDSKGVPFIYHKTVRVPLKFKRIKKITYHDTFCKMHLDGVPFPFKLKRPPIMGERWASVLYYKNAPFMIYNTHQNKGKDSFRLI